jgi:serine/threonine-protein kinase
MTDSPTERLAAAFEGRYRILERLGEGGMAVVYLAEDLKHGRRVAIKVLKPELAAMIGGERFLSEIQTTANLQHPNILGLYDSGSEGGILYYVMPYVEGESLRDWIDREKQLAVADAVRVATSVASALQFAHERGVIHRDIKPENILLQAGQPVVADFGIALAISAAGGGRMTETGLSLGTPHYMSPEQATADRDLSPRSDVYALACVLYEMLAGAPPHAGPTAQASLMKILTEDATPVTRLRRSVPANVDAAIQHALEKLPADRIQSAAAFAEALADETYSWTAPTRIASAARPGASSDAGSGASALPRWWPVAAAALVLVSLGIGTILGGGGGPSGGADAAAGPSVEFELVPSTHTLLSPCCGRFVAVSPQGDRIVYQAAEEDGGLMLFQRRIDEREGRPIPGTEDARHPFFSPDGAWLGFFGNNEVTIYKTRFDGGTPQRVADRVGSHPALGGAAWGPDNTIVFADRGDAGLYRVSAEGGDPRPLTTLAEGDASHRWPHVLPDGRTVLYSVSRTSSEVDLIRAVSIDGGESTDLIQGADPRYVEPGWLVYADGSGGIFAQPFDADALRVGEGRIRIADEAVFRGWAAGLQEYDISRNGVLAFMPGRYLATERRLLLVDEVGRREDITSGLIYTAPRVSPSGRWIAYEEAPATGAPSDIWVWDLERANPSRLTFGEAYEGYPAWSPDEDVLTYWNGQTGQIERRRRDGTGTPEPLDMEVDGLTKVTYSPDGAWIVSVRSTPDTSNDIWIQPTDGSGPARPFLSTPVDEDAPSVSPDGRWIAYVANAAGGNDVYVERFPDGGGRHKVSSQGGRSPGWSPDGSRLYFRKFGPTASASDSMAVADVRIDGDRFETGPPRTMFRMYGVPTANGWREWDILPDGSRFVLIAATEDEGGGSRLAVVTNAIGRVVGDG